MTAFLLCVCQRIKMFSEDFSIILKVQQLSQQKSVNQTCSETINIWKVSHGATPGYSCFQTEKTVKKIEKLWGQYRLA